jgi:peptidyl-prolyl cis-trans isomerase D
MKKNERDSKQMKLVVEYVLIEDKASKKTKQSENKINQLLTGSVVYNQATGKMIH